MDGHSPREDNTEAFANSSYEREYESYKQKLFESKTMSRLGGLNFAGPADPSSGRGYKFSFGGEVKQGSSNGGDTPLFATERHLQEEALSCTEELPGQESTAFEGMSSSMTQNEDTTCVNSSLHSSSQREESALAFLARQNAGESFVDSLLRKSMQGLEMAKSMSAKFHEFWGDDCQSKHTTPRC